MAALSEVNENTSAFMTIVPKDKSGSAVTPTSMSYRIDCETTGTAIKAETSLTPGTSVALTVTPTENRIITASNVEEIRVLTVQCVYSAATDEIQEQFRWRVKNLEYTI